MVRRFCKVVLFTAAMLLAAAPVVLAQDNYEIQVYEYDTVEPGHTMVELHSNFTIDGSKTVQDGVLPTNHAEHETIETVLSPLPDRRASHSRPTATRRPTKGLAESSRSALV